MELALDLTPDAVILCERKPHGSWRKFASARLDDPEFATVIGILRADAEAYAGARVPVRLWLPPEQVLKKRAWVGNGQPAPLRQRAAFDHVERATVYRPEDVAVAVGPVDDEGNATILITFAKTWHEARDYATRWGFLPGPVSTRHEAEEFGAAGPVFLLRPDAPAPSTSGWRWRPLILGGAALAVLAAGTIALTLGPWNEPPAAPPAPSEASLDLATGPPPATIQPTPVTDAPTVVDEAGSGLAPAEVSQPAAPAPSAAPSPPVPAPDPLAARPAPPAAPQAPDQPSGDPPAMLAPPPPSVDPHLVHQVSLTLWQPTPTLPAVAPPVATEPEPTAVPEPQPDLADLPPLPIPAPRPSATETPAAAQSDTAQPDTGGEPEPEPQLATLPPMPVPAPRPGVAERPAATDAITPAEGSAPADATTPTPPTAAAEDTPDVSEVAVLAAPLPKARPVRSGKAALIGIINLNSGRKALLRLSDGRFRTVAVGDDVDGWKVSMIGNDAMRISRGSKDRTLLLITP